MSSKKIFIIFSILLNVTHTISSAQRLPAQPRGRRVVAHPATESVSVILQAYNESLENLQKSLSTGQNNVLNFLQKNNPDQARSVVDSLRRQRTIAEDALQKLMQKVQNSKPEIVTAEFLPFIQPLSVDQWNKAQQDRLQNIHIQVSTLAQRIVEQERPVQNVQQEIQRPPSPEPVQQLKRQKVEQRALLPELEKNTLQHFAQALQKMRESLIHFDEEYAKTDNFNIQASSEFLDSARQEYGLAFDALGLLQESFLTLDDAQRQRMNEQLGKPVEAWTGEQFNVLRTYLQIIDEKNRALQRVQAQIALAVIKQSEDWLHKAQRKARAAEEIISANTSNKDSDVFKRAVHLLFAADAQGLNVTTVLRLLRIMLFTTIDDQMVEDYQNIFADAEEQNKSLEEMIQQLMAKDAAASFKKQEEKEQAAAVMQPVQEQEIAQASQPAASEHIEEPCVPTTQAPKSPLAQLRERKKALARKPKGDILRNLNQQAQKKVCAQMKAKKIVKRRENKI